LLETLIKNHFDANKTKADLDRSVEECYESFAEGFPVAVKKAKLQYEMSGQLSVPQPRLVLGDSFDINDKDLFTKRISLSYDKRIIRNPVVTACSLTPASFPFGYSITND